MSDWIGLAFFVLLIVAALVAIKVLANPRPRTSEEFERNAAEGTTMLGAGMNALHEMINPEAAKAKEVIEQMKDGRYHKKKREGEAGGTDNSETTNGENDD